MPPLSRNKPTEREKMSGKLNPDSPVPLYLQLRDLLRHQILSGDSTEFLPKEEDLCKIYGVSRRTVSRAMALLAKSGLVRRIKRKGTLIRHNDEVTAEGHIGLVFPITTDWKDTLQTMQQAAVALGRSLVVFPYEWFNEVEEQKAILVAKNSCDGIIIYPNGKETDLQNITDLYNTGYPVVMFDIYYEECECSYVGMDHFLCGKRLTEALIRTPNDRIGIIQCINSQIQRSVVERVAGFHHALERAKIKFDARHELKLYSFDWEKNTREIGIFLEKNRLDGVFVTDQNCYPWEDIGMLDIPPLRISTTGMRPSYSRYANINYAEQPEDEIGRLAIQLLNEKINDPATPSKRIMVSPRYHWRR